MSLFDKAQTTTQAAPKAKATKTPEVAMKGVRDLAQLSALIEALSTMKSTRETELKASAMGQFYRAGKAMGVRPPNFKAIDTDATASMQLKTRSSASGFGEDELELLKQYELTPVKNVAVQAMFGINPKYMFDSAMLEKVSKAIESIVPVDFIVKQEEKSKEVSSDELVTEAFKKGLPQEVISILTTQAIRATLTKPMSITEMLDEIKSVFEVKEVGEKKVA